MFTQRAAGIKREFGSNVGGIGGGFGGRAPEVITHSGYPHRLQMYNKPPELEITIEEFESFALDRLQVLKAVEMAQLRGQGTDDCRRRINESLSKYLPMHSDRMGGTRPRQIIAERRKDHISHFILRLAFSRSEDLRQWFLRQETALFRHRYREVDSADRQSLLNEISFDLKILSPQEKAKFIEEMDIKGFYPQDEQLFEVDFRRVLDLVGRRQAILRKGRAYIAQSNLATLVINEYQKRLGRALEICAKALPRMDEDERLLPILQNMSSQYGSQEYQSTNAAGAVTADSVDSLTAHFPLCMRQLHGKLKEESHLKHFGRMQFGLFLKGIGLSLPEALLYWRKAFSRMTDDQFQKGYAYNIRHNYGMEGKRTDYTPYSCGKIITTNAPSSGDHHGCPFRHSGQDKLRAMLFHGGLKDSEVRDVADYAQKGHYQIACTKYLELQIQKRRGGGKPSVLAGSQANSGVVIESITHPNQYFDLSLGDGQLKNNNSNGSGKYAASYGSTQNYQR
ncbi:DNA primase subunit pri2 [Mycoemilia scoparia]|uniref:DNA primase large subunit n=1 Tax=Mycoemilia scoparia TaxID=417184 RepID=A0A9W8DTV6_9FUNG|nr:DNA primase subunit pri2 [Mycoemilia scoparia]